MNNKTKNPLLFKIFNLINKKGDYNFATLAWENFLINRIYVEINVNAVNEVAGR